MIALVKYCDHQPCLCLKFEQSIAYSMSQVLSNPVL